MNTLYRSALFLVAFLPLCAASLDLTKAVVVVRPGERPNAEKAAATILVEEVEKRTGIRLPVSTTLPTGATAIAITAPDSQIPPEGYRLHVDGSTVAITGADARGALYGAGQLLRRLDWTKGKLSLAYPLDITTSPAYPIRGHQLGYRTQANSYDAWSAAQFEQYIRELTYFGVNSIEGIPFHDDRKTPVMKVPRREMNRAIGEICNRYGLDYWIWVPADFDLKDHALRTQMLDRIEEFSNDTPELTGFFFPGGDPGQNPAELVLPFLEDVAKRMLPRHPKAKVWLSLQWFTPPQVDFVYRYLDRTNPSWFAGLVAGPSGPSIPATRRRLPAKYQLRLYPDLTHNKISQYEVPNWDQAYALTLGREAINPRPAEFARIFQHTAPFSNGFISYSDGVHDDVNKTIWSELSWNPDASVLDILTDYARVYFNPSIGGANAILALERNWNGSLVDNGSVEGTLQMWQSLEQRAPELSSNWRWQMCLLRANYDAYIRHRLIHETKLEAQANRFLADAGKNGSDRAMTEAMRVLNQPVSDELRARIVDLCEKLFHSIGLQTSVEKYYASGEERGAVLDFIDYPLNNRWWLEDEFKRVRQLPSDVEKERRLKLIATWENPGPGSFYDVVGNISKSPHVMRTEKMQPLFWWWDEGKSRARLTWQVTMWPVSVNYDGLDPKASYRVRTTGYGQALLRMNGDHVEPTLDGKDMGEFKEWPVPSKYIEDGKLVLTWDKPTNEGDLNWRKKSRLSEVWLLKTTAQ